MPNAVPDAEKILLKSLRKQQAEVVKSTARRLLVVAGAGSGKTEVMSRRVAWWVGVSGVPKHSVVAFTFTEAAAEELKFRIRAQIEKITPRGDDVTLGGMYIGTIHGFCLKLLREYWPDDYHNYDVLDEIGRAAFASRGFFEPIGLKGFQQALTDANSSRKYPVGQYEAMDLFLSGYDLLNEYDELDVKLPAGSPPHDLRKEGEWCAKAKSLIDGGKSEVAKAFAFSAARYYAYLRCRRFLDFSTVQTELLRRLADDAEARREIAGKLTHIVVDEVQDINLVQDKLIRALVGQRNYLTAVGDHRQAIYGWRGGRVDIMATLHGELKKDRNGEVIDLHENFRSTDRIIQIANAWAASIGQVGDMGTPPMSLGRAFRVDGDPSHVATLSFETCQDEAKWIASQIRKLVPDHKNGAFHDTDDGDRGLTLSDVAILVRSSTDARTYMRALYAAGIPSVVQAGPDLFSQPEVLFFLALIAKAAGMDKFFGSTNDPRSLPKRITDTLACNPEPDEVVLAAAAALAAEGIPVCEEDASHALSVADAIRRRVASEAVPSLRITNTKLAEFLAGRNPVRRVFPQAILQWLFSEAGIAEWEAVPGRGETAFYHLGALSKLVKGIETPGWTSAKGFKYQMIGLSLQGAQNGRAEEAPLLVPVDAVTISTIHGAKGLEYPAVFVADVKARRFPSQRARQIPDVPFDEPLLGRIDPTVLADNTNWDNERRLMYVAATRAERYLFITASGKQTSAFMKEIAPIVAAHGGVAHPKQPDKFLKSVQLRPAAARRDVRLVTSFSDLRYYLACPHDFYLRKVLGFAPTIDQAFGYGRGVHNLLRAIHSEPKTWAKLAKDPEELADALRGLVADGLFYLRYTTGDPAENMQKKAVKIVGEYVGAYGAELDRLEFEPEREFETLIEEEKVLVSGAIDIVRLDEPPRVTLIDFKSGEAESDVSSKLDEDEMRLQICLYGLAAKKELEYEPERGLVRYLGEEDAEKRELGVDLDNDALKEARATVLSAARDIRNRKFAEGPRRKAKNPDLASRCGECDFCEFCGRPEAVAERGGARPSGRRGSR
jgi:DNA helicase II / ATP-dependent DNA helicase PcrA